MIRSLLWKDAREHLATVLTLCLGGIGLMIGVGALMTLESGNTPMRTGQATGMCILLLTPGIALLMGSLFLGSDKENGVSSWLDSLPESAWKIWLARNVFAIASQLALVVAWGVMWRIFYAPVEKLFEPGMLVFLLVSSLMGTGWGQWGMHRSRTVFGGFGNGLLGLIAAGLVVMSATAVLLFLAHAAAREFRADHFPPYLDDLCFIFGTGILVVLPFVLVFIGLSRQFGLPNASKNSYVRVLSRMWWLSTQAQNRPFLIMSAIGLVLGFMLSESFLIWPIWSLSIGVVSGLCVLSKDQNGASGFHGAMRVFRPYLLDLRAVPSFLVGLILNLFPLLPLGVAGIYRGIVNQGTEQHFAQLFWPGIGQFIPVAPYICLWYCAGFGTALWCSLFLEKPVVAFVVSWGLGAIVSSVWVPALLGGSLSVLWIFGLVAVFWFLGRYLYRGFVSQNLAKAGPQSFVLMVACVGLFCGLGILSRLYPARGQAEDPFSLEEISRELKSTNPKLEDEIRRHLVDNRRGIGATSQFHYLPESTDLLLNTPISGWSEKVVSFLKETAPKNSKEFAEDWKVPNEVVGLFGATQAERILSEPFYWSNEGQFIVMQMQTRGIVSLWEVSRGKKEAEEKFANEIDRMLFMGECLRHKSHFQFYLWGEQLERLAYRMIDYHLSQNKPTESGLAALAKVLEKVETRSKQVKPMTREIGFWMSRKSNDYRSLWRKTNSQGPTFADKPWVDAYWQLVDFALSAPWEKERARKLVNHWFSSNPPTDRYGSREQYDYDLDLIPFWHFNTWASASPNGQLSIEQRGQMTNVIHDLAKTAIALKRFRVAKGSWPKALNELSPAYLKEVPKDSYSQGDFGFRIIEAVKPLKVAPDKSGSDRPAGAGEGDSAPGMAVAGMPPGASAGMGGFPDSLQLPDSGQMEIPLVPGTLVLWSVGLDKKEPGALRSNGPGGPRYSGMVFVIAP